MTNNGNNRPEAPQPETAGSDAPENGAQTADADLSQVEMTPSEASAAPLTEEVTDLSPEARIEALKAELAEAKDLYLRSHAEMENLRKRTERELANKSKFAVQKFAENILSVADNIQRAIQSVSDEELRDNQSLKNLLGGITLTERELINALEKHDIRPFEAEGAQLDPNIHLAMFEIDNPDVPAGTILQVVQAGYMIGDRLLRPAHVGVARGGPKPGVAPESAEEPGDLPASAAANDDHSSGSVPVDDMQSPVADDATAPGGEDITPDGDPTQNS